MVVARFGSLLAIPFVVLTVWLLGNHITEVEGSLLGGGLILAGYTLGMVAAFRAEARAYGDWDTQYGNGGAWRRTARRLARRWSR